MKDEVQPDTLILVYEFGAYYRKLGRNKKAMQRMEKTIDVRKRITGKEHPGTFTSMRSLAISYGNLSQKRVAMQLTSKMLDVQKEFWVKSFPIQFCPCTTGCVAK